MPATKPKRAERSRTKNRAKPELPWNVFLHNDWNTSAQRLEQLDAAGRRRAQESRTRHDDQEGTRIMWEAHSSGRAVVKSCHKELAELYKERLQEEGLTVSIEPA